ncbi:hypothetical protein [Scytonema hofmannii]|uniref:hypothetical protein n=1 Tax=Scytonema hofmannii TaxID=34078 RepID=UPI0011DF1C6A|nr:hypothetical protein [Scytonema hofmannii]
MLWAITSGTLCAEFIINGNPGFDRYVQTINGSKVFVGDRFRLTTAQPIHGVRSILRKTLPTMAFNFNLAQLMY